MALRNPVSVYIPANNAEAQLICNLLNEEGIEAFAMEDISQAGVTSLGLLPGIHKPQIWVDREMVDKARERIGKYDRSLANPGGNAAAKLFCYQCGEAVSAKTTKCPACGKTLDWSDEPQDEEPSESPKTARGNKKKKGARSAAAPPPESGMQVLRKFRGPIAALFLLPVIIMFGLLILMLAVAIYQSLTGTRL